MKLISIITAAYNSSNEILETYKSISSQTYSHWEWLVTDDCSSDNTYNLLIELARKDARVKVFKNSVNSGAAVSRNNSLSHALGEFIAFVDSDDLWLPNKLLEQITFMQSDSEINFSFTAYELIDAQGNRLNKEVDAAKVGKFSYGDQLRKKATMGCSTVVLRRCAFGDISMPLLRTGQDYALWLKLLKTGNCAYLLPKVLTQYRILPDSISRNKFKKMLRQWHIYRNVEKLDIFLAAKCFCFYAWRAVFRK